MKNILFVMSVLCLMSCNNDDQLEFYNSKNRSEKFFGKWIITDNQMEEIMLEFNSNEYVTYSNNNEQLKSNYVWYNDNTKIYYMRNGKGSGNDSQSTMLYLLNNSNDTLKISFGDSIWETYIRY